MMDSSNIENENYASLLAIRARKTELRKQLEESGNEVHALWNEIFRPAQPNPQSPTERFMSFVGNSVGLIDGAILGWKLYRRFRK